MIVKRIWKVEETADWSKEIFGSRSVYGWAMDYDCRLSYVT